MNKFKLNKFNLQKFRKRIFISFFIIFLIIFYSSSSFAATLVSVNPQEKYVGPNVLFTIDIDCVPSQPVKAFELIVHFNSSVLQAINVTEGDLFDPYPTFFNAGVIDNIKGEITEIYDLILGDEQVNSPGTMIQVSFVAKNINASSFIELVNVGVTNITSYVSVTISNGTVRVDTVPPNVINKSPSQGSTGDQFIFNATVSDNINDYEDLTVMVNWTHGSTSGNITMNYAGGSYFTKAITLNQNSVNNLNYKFYAADSFGNSVTTTNYYATVIDNDKPVISSISAAPSVQEIGKYVNISAKVTDNILVNNVFLNIVYPNSNSENYSIVGNKSGTYFFSNKTYTIPGTYVYHFYAVDSNNNYVVSANNNFIIKDITAPVISNINIQSSNPKDTDSSFGWVNITCTVTDNIGVIGVFLNIKKPNNALQNISMTHGQGNNYYYNSSTTFSLIGNYTYYICANDSAGNFKTSSSFLFSLPPNWDINMDGKSSVLDLIQISNHYNESNNFGWIREDVDNNGIIRVIDMNLVANHYGETWWV